MIGQYGNIYPGQTDTYEARKNIDKISKDLTEELAKDDVDNKKVFKLIYQQFMQGLLLNDGNYRPDRPYW